MYIYIYIHHKIRTVSQLIRITTPTQKQRSSGYEFLHCFTAKSMVNSKVHDVITSRGDSERYDYGPVFDLLVEHAKVRG